VILAYVIGSVRAFRESLAAQVASSGKVRVVGTSAPGGRLVQKVSELGADVVLLDMGIVDALGTLRTLVEALSQTKIVAVALAREDVIPCAEAGAAGFALAEAPVEEILAATEGAVRGELFCSPQIAAALLGRVAALASAQRAQGASPLTVRELEIIELLDGGLSNKEIASRLSIEVPTVKNHVHNILEKLDVRSRTDAVAEARRQGLRRVVLKT
jgi:two-component system nitrate/nitrite response regulator NarL